MEKESYISSFSPSPLLLTPLLKQALSTEFEPDNCIPLRISLIFLILDSSAAVQLATVVVEPKVTVGLFALSVTIVIFLIAFCSYSRLS